jgi:hypothetical protein
LYSYIPTNIEYVIEIYLYVIFKILTYILLLFLS